MGKNDAISWENTELSLSEFEHGWMSNFISLAISVPFDGWLNLKWLLLHGPYIYTETPKSKSLMNNNKKIYNEFIEE